MLSIEYNGNILEVQPGANGVLAHLQEFDCITQKERERLYLQQFLSSI